ncbi:MAG: hypothetical protein R3F17_11685 [Planctomycetota bacterium]
MQDLAAVPSPRNALTRGLPGPSGLRLEERDLEVYETEHDTSCATVLDRRLALDDPHGEDRITPAKQLALASPSTSARTTLAIASKWCCSATMLGRCPRPIPYCGVGPFHTNARAGLRLAMDLLPVPPAEPPDPDDHRRQNHRL